MVPQAQQRLTDVLGNLVNGTVAVNLGETVAMLAIVLDYRSSFLLECPHPLMKHLHRIVGTLNECGSVKIADPVVLRWFRVNVINCPADWAGEASRDPLEQHLLVDNDVDRNDGQKIRHELPIEPLR